MSVIIYYLFYFVYDYEQNSIQKSDSGILVVVYSAVVCSAAQIAGIGNGITAYQTAHAIAIL